jgi:hypothetical protein
MSDEKMMESRPDGCEIEGCPVVTADADLVRIVFLRDLDHVEQKNICLRHRAEMNAGIQTGSDPWTTEQNRLWTERCLAQKWRPKVLIPESTYFKRMLGAL